MKSLSSNSEKPAIYFAIDKSLNIINYDSDNLYPQRVQNLVKASPRADECDKVRERFIYGNGFKNSDLSQLVVNRKGQTMDVILELLTKDISLFQDGYLQIQYNEEYKIEEIYLLPFEGVRKGSPLVDKTNGKVVYYNDWEKLLNPSIKRDEFIWLNPFNANPKVIDREIDENMENIKVDKNREVDPFFFYNGQFVQVKPADEIGYSTCIFESAYEDAITDAAIKRFRFKNVKNDFNASLLMFFSKFKDEETRSATIKNLKQFQGEENANSLMAFELEEGSEPPKLEKVEKNNFDGYYKETFEQVRETIRGAYEIHPALLESTPGKLGQDSTDATQIYNTKIERERTRIQSVFYNIFKNSIWADQFSTVDSFDLEVFSFNFDLTKRDETKVEDAVEAVVQNKFMNLIKKYIK